MALAFALPCYLSYLEEVVVMFSEEDRIRCETYFQIDLDYKMSARNDCYVQFSLLPVR